ncbi:MAG: hypothetical protein P9L88_04690 [Candidatus Tantalella remota]|nr:hypothetical protein [Candidatus Tantalella remota]
MNRIILVGILFVLMFVRSSFAYFEDYPPRKFTGKPYPHLECEPVVTYDTEQSEFSAQGGKIEVKMKKTLDGVHFIVRDGDNILVENLDIEETLPQPWNVYWTDIDNNGFNDFIVISTHMGNGLGASSVQVDIYLKSKEQYVHIQYDNLFGGMGNFVDIDGDDKYEIIITDVCSGEYEEKPHNYMFYNIYSVDNYKLVNADDRFEGFPKFIWMTNNPNDKDTIHLTQKERQKYTSEKNRSIKYVIANDSEKAL